MGLTQAEIILRLFLSILLGGIIGIERESVNRPAGFRTHVLVCTGSTLTMLVSIYMFEKYRALTTLDPARIAAQVVSGIGFLGAGTIIRVGPTVRGLTTAASLWTVGSIGLAVGSGFYLAAIAATFFTFVTLISLSRIENFIVGKKLLQSLSLVVDDKPGQIGRIGTILGEMGVSIKKIRIESTEGSRVVIVLLLRLPSNVKLDEVITRLSQTEGIYSIEV
ncbi:MgtC/SapB family protein [Thermosediminibacter litoriperuensis]|uniref:Putative Mg2+ transporter-C (MgtC) family protein n=1 Tax=Thermosediminibacter litoriperuensis TaxID=291989 RepID=A0A5S5ARY6_9FIRM|nr:MgtC/SapB family protein [Thermosediminibacter litoriperuensis]TYP54288.1 putative Mg2+ transporter-C (MgtC) family protein [Thermosediminibacter litoriperuensis]